MHLLKFLDFDAVFVSMVLKIKGNTPLFHIKVCILAHQSVDSAYVLFPDAYVVVRGGNIWDADYRTRQNTCMCDSDTKAQFYLKDCVLVGIDKNIFSALFGGDC